MLAKKVVFALAILLLVFFSGCAQQLPKLPGQDQNAPPTDNNQPVPDLNADRNIPLPVLPDNNAPSTLVSLVMQCNAQPSEVQRDVCFRDKAALASVNVVLCDKLVTLSKNDCLSRAGIALKDKTICQRITDSNIADGCYGSVAEDTNAYSLCNNIVTAILRANCLSTIGKAEKILDACKDIPTTTQALIVMRDDCLEEVAVAQKNHAPCEYLYSATAAGSAKDNCYWTIVQLTKNRAICPLISDKNKNDGCFDFVARDSNEASLCLNIAGANTQIACIKFVAEKSSNAGYCSLIKDANQVSECKNNLVSKIPTIDLCNSFPDAKHREDCYFSFSMSFDANYCKQTIDQNKNPNCLTGCKSVSIDMNTADACFSGTAIKISRAEYCANIRVSSVTERNNCYTVIAKANLDTSLCKNIFNNVSNYAKCFTNIAIKTTDYTVCNQAKTDFPFETYSSANWCIYYYADDRNNTGDCNKIKDSGFAAQCISNITS